MIGENILQLLRQINQAVWGLPTLLLILGAGIYFTVRSRFFQLTYFPKAFRAFLSKLRKSENGREGVSPYQALCTALAATVGTGNIAGVAGAISLGGPGAVFWMWVCAFLGMILKCAEAVLAVHYRQKNDDGQYYGGPMYMIEKGMSGRWRFLAVLYAFFGVIAAFGVGNATQINAILGGVHSAADYFGIPFTRSSDLFLAGILAVMVARMLSGGAKQIGQIAEMLVPYAALTYLVLGIGVLIARAGAVPAAFSSILTAAFSPKAITGGMIGSVFAVCRIGASRGVFTNEAGMGTASMAHAAAFVKHPCEQGLMGIIEVFIDTIVICTVTALVILCSGYPIPYGTDTGAELTTAAFSQIYGGWVSIVISVCLICFALGTVLGWGYYGICCARYLFSGRSIKWFIALQAVTVVFSVLLKTSTVWLLAETVNALMAIPNLIVLIGLCPEFINLIHDYKIGEVNQTSGGTYENLNQCKPVRTVSYAEISSAGSAGTK